MNEMKKICNIQQPRSSVFSIVTLTLKILMGETVDFINYRFFLFCML
jgi:hypothetical protein